MELTGMTLSEIFFMEAIVVALAICLEIPSGALADLIGRKQTILIGMIMQVFGMVAFAMMGNPLHLWLSNIAWMVALSLRSGADTAFAYDTLVALGREHEAIQLEGRANSYGIYAQMIGSLAAGHLAAIHLRLPLWLCVPGIVVSTICVFLFREAPATKPFSAKEQVDQMKAGVRSLVTNTRVRYAVALAAVVPVATKLWFFSDNPYFVEVEVPLVWYGYITAVAYFITGTTSRHAGEIEKWLGREKLVAVLPLIAGVGCYLYGALAAIPAIGLIACRSLALGVVRPFSDTVVNEKTSREERATVLSVKRSLTSISQVAALALFALLRQYQPLTLCLEVTGLAALIGGLVVIQLYKRRSR